MASYNEIVLEISEAVKIIDFREEFMKQNATKLLFPTVTKSCIIKLRTQIRTLN
ncbi:hypothetical protein RirG_196800 [Rhizophagus irregularis DAOM 197198w]|uniref:Uncharacterized protein n=1 Tax=Rhizophagus irregularis (strain DAOM 197198w) TaxID=1432141 RepID=A0A015KG18_RHIIW|nr:hypothetical protein RirG_196800 [Rhizophagus irregularis DAOM 197198w]